MLTHHIQREIIDRLSHAPTLRFSELKLREFESNLFVYHLKQLIREGYVEKAASVYRLAPKGLTYVDGLSLASRKPRHQPKVVAILILRDASGRWLFGRRKLQPYIHKLMFLSGKQHFGESPEAHARRELLEKTGLETPLAHHGIVDIRIHLADATLTHIVGRLYAGTVAPDAVPAETDQHLYEWHQELPAASDTLPGTVEIAKALQSPADPILLSLDLEFNAADVV